MQNKLAEGIPVTCATDDKILRKLVRERKLRNFVRGKTPEHLYVFNNMPNPSYL